MKTELLQGFYLGDLFIEPLRGQVSGPGHSAHLAPRATEVLMLLASRPGELVPRDEILAEVWGADGGSPEALSHAISDIRHALIDTASNPRFIQTVPRRGYRLVASPQAPEEPGTGVFQATQTMPRIEELGLFESLLRRGVLEAGIAYLILGWLLIQIADVVFEQLLLPQWTATFVTVLVIAGFPIVLILSWFLEFRDGRAVVDRGPQLRSPQQRFSRTYLVVVSALAVASVLVYAYDRYVGLPQAVTVPAVAELLDADLPPVEPESIAVLPFLNVDGSDKAGIFASGLAEDMINQLALVPGLSVASRGDAWSLGATASSVDVRRRLRVAYYVEGSVRLDGDSIGVNVKLIDSETGFPIISRNFEEALEDFNKVQRDLMSVTVANLRVALPANTQTILRSAYAEADLDAYILYRRGKEIYEQPRTEESLAEAIRLYDQALRFDPGYAAAHAGLCNAYIELYELSGAADDIERAETACSRALDSNPRLYMVFSALGDLYWRTGRIDAAEDAYQDALAINPQDVQAMGGLADVYRRNQRLDEAEELLNSAIRKQPGNWRAFNRLGSFLFNMGRFGEAADAYREVVELDRDNFQARSNLGSALTMAGDFEQGRRVLEESLAIRPLQRTYSNLGVIYYFLGDFDKSVETHRKAVEQAPGDALVWLNLGDSLHFAGDEEQSVAAFDRARELSLAALSVNATDNYALFTLAWAQHRIGDSTAALDTIRRGLRFEPRDPYGHYYEALIRYEMGDEDAALASLGAALENGYPPGMLVAEPYLGELRANDKFHALLIASF